MPPRRPYGAQGTGQSPTAAIRGPGDRPLFHGGHTGRGNRPRPHRGHTGPRGPATPSGRPYGALGIGHVPTAAIWHPGYRPRPHGGHTGPRKPATPLRQPYGTQGTATPPRRPYGAQGTNHAHRAAIRGPGDRPRPHSDHTGPRGPATPPG